MLPALRPGDRLLVSYRRAPRAGDLVVARLADGTVSVEPAWWLVSDNPAEGVDSRHRGPVAEADVIAVTVARIWPRPRPL
jgi:alpha-D-ribose 1-methylphosphonate 5-triphosphate diphosphatase PhnM